MAPKKKANLPVISVEAGGLVDMMAGRGERTAEVLKELAKKYGEGILTMGGKVAPVKRIPTGIFPLDLALLGGVPAGRITVMKGRKSSCKTTLALKIASSVQRRCVGCWNLVEACECGLKQVGSVAYFDVEGTMTSNWAKAWGVNPDLVLWSRPEVGDYMVDMIEQIVKERISDLIIVDSVAAVQTSAESEKTSATEDTVAVLAKLMSKFMRMLGRLANEQERLCGWRPTVILLNQMRDAFGMAFQHLAPTAPGGHMIGFAASVELDLKAVQQPGSEKAKGTGTYGYKVSKSKVSMPYLEGTFDIVFDEAQGVGQFGQCLDVEDVFKAANGNELQKVKGQYILTLSDGPTDLGTTQGAVQGWLLAHAGPMQELKDLILKRVSYGG